ncbi:hypothetical protein [Microvirga terricola]|uniref:Uncharacterized protein n=1 Tax=Microvirga terricola TaxID=2719797 RepID=A0ABX0VE30_9HYPH|nr:hypothetical protein [Microvirga terricola]NIX77902.1 hypothetical protein [Microvirga terricola]
MVVSFEDKRCLCGKAYFQRSSATVGFRIAAKKRRDPSFLPAARYGIRLSFFAADGSEKDARQTASTTFPSTRERGFRSRFERSGDEFLDALNRAAERHLFAAFTQD